MNRIERAIDGASPVLGARMRLLKTTLRKDVITRFINCHVSCRSTAIDIGANRGVYTWALSSKVGPDGRVTRSNPSRRTSRGSPRSPAPRKQLTDEIDRVSLVK